MKKFSFVFFLFFILISLQVESSLFLCDQGKPSAPLKKLLEVLNVPNDGSWEGIKEATQKAWLRPIGKERWEIDEIHWSNPDEIKILLREIGLLDEVKPDYGNYAYAIVLGGILPRVRTRLAYLVKLWEAGIRFEQLVFLNGLRPLTQTTESEDMLKNQHNGILPFRSDWNWNEGNFPPTNESEMAKMIYDQALLPEQMRKIHVTFIETPNQKKEDGTERRANTDDTLVYWKGYGAIEGFKLFISSQPFIGYQEAMMKMRLPNKSSVCGPGIVSPDNFSIAICLDSLARTLYVLYP